MSIELITAPGGGRATVWMGGARMGAAIRMEDVRRIQYGYIVSPVGSSDAGQLIPVCGYAVRHRGGVLLFDTGIAPFDDETRDRYYPRVRSVEEALHSAELKITDVDLIANCHMHADHAGGNHRFPDVPVLVQRAELEAERAADYTFPAYAYEYPGARLEVVEGKWRLPPAFAWSPPVGIRPGTSRC